MQKTFMIALLALGVLLSSCDACLDPEVTPAADESEAFERPGPQSK